MNFIVEEVLSKLDLLYVPPFAQEKLLSYVRIWKQWNPKVRLTAENDETTFFQKHVFDSIQYLFALEPNQDKFIMDIGSGGGFPGIPLKIFLSDHYFFLVESQRKRANFIKTVIREMAFNKIECHNARAEELFGNTQLKFSLDVVLFKAVAPLEDCLQMGYPFLKKDGKIIVRKGMEDGITIPPNLSLQLIKEVPVVNWLGVPSRLLVFQNCST